MKTTLVAITGNEMNLTPEELIIYIARVSNPANQNNTATAPKLLRYCLEHKHWSPFEHVSMTVEIETSRAIAAQILRHRSFSFQEFSQRYASVDKMGEELFEPVELRAKNPGGNRQGSDTETVKELKLADGSTCSADDIVLGTIGIVKTNYELLLRNGVAPEVARMILPLCTKTRLYMTGSVRSWIHYLQLRLDGHAQKEHRAVAAGILEIFRAKFPLIAAELFPA